MELTAKAFSASTAVWSKWMGFLAEMTKEVEEEEAVVG